MGGSKFRLVIAKFNQSSGCNDWLELGYVERERAPSQLMKLEFRYHLSGLSLSNTLIEIWLWSFAIRRSVWAILNSSFT